MSDVADTVHYDVEHDLDDDLLLRSVSRCSDV